MLDPTPSEAPPASTATSDRAVRGGPAAPTYVGIGVIAAFAAVLGIWGSLAPVSGAAIAEGSLKIEGNRQTVQHPYGGVVQDLKVKEGDRVVRGQVLLTLSDAEPRAKLDVLIGQRNALKAEEGRLIAERDGRDEPSFDRELLAEASNPSVAQSIANERAVMAARRRQYETEIGMLRQKIAQLREQKRGSEAQLTGIDRQSELIEEEAKGARELLKSGYTPKTRVLALERTAAGLLADRGARLSDIASTEEAIGGAELEIAKRDRERTTEVTNALRTVQSSLAEVGPKIEAARDVLDRTQVTAPATGSVVGLSVFTEGGVIQPGARVLDIVPTANALTVEGRLQLYDVSEVAVGRSADVRLTSINRSERPQLRGQITNVSADRLTDERSGQAYYLVQVRLEPQDVGKSTVALQAGMPAQIVVTTRPRTLIDYLVAPLADEFSGAFRER